MNQRTIAVSMGAKPAHNNQLLLCRRILPFLVKPLHPAHRLSSLHRSSTYTCRHMPLFPAYTFQPTLFSPHLPAHTAQADIHAGTRLTFLRDPPWQPLLLFLLLFTLRCRRCRLFGLQPLCVVVAEALNTLARLLARLLAGRLARLLAGRLDNCRRLGGRLDSGLGRLALQLGRADVTAAQGEAEFQQQARGPQGPVAATAAKVCFISKEWLQTRWQPLRLR